LTVIIFYQSPCPKREKSKFLPSEKAVEVCSCTNAALSIQTVESNANISLALVYQVRKAWIAYKSPFLHFKREEPTLMLVMANQSFIIVITVRIHFPNLRWENP
jgi:hypothetical protein